MVVRLLVTGGAGFIGSNFVHYWFRQVSRLGEPFVVVLDALTYAGRGENLESLEADVNLYFVHGDICDRPLLDQLLRQYDIDAIIHFAAESHVDRSIAGPAPFIQTNFVGTFNLLEAFRVYWEEQQSPAHYRFIHVSTDEVFGTIPPEIASVTEDYPYQPNSPYAASKAGSDHLVRSYYYTYKLPTIITSASNNYGPYQYPEKLIPLMILNSLQGKPLPVYGDGQQVRNWIYVEDHCQALVQVLLKGLPGERYNIGGHTEIPNLELVEQLCDRIDEAAPQLPMRPCRKLITFVKDRPGHDRRYTLDSSKIRDELGWLPQVSLAEGLDRTITWYMTHRTWWEPLINIPKDDFY
ncbi:MAG: dTDP-glucose 4,6-dehydratase [Cyanobacteria bacterium P01_F01_bin.86]